jgi:hypothetical protein
VAVFTGGTIWTVVYSFTDSRLLPRERWVGLQQYERLWGEDRWLISIENLLIYGVLSLIFSLVVGFILAALLDQRDPGAASRWLCSEQSDRDLTVATEALSSAEAEIGLEWSEVTETDRTVGQATVTAELSTGSHAATWTFTLVAEDGDPQWLVCDIDSD